LENCGKIIFYDGMGRKNEFNSIKLEIEKVVEYIFPVRGYDSTSAMIKHNLCVI